MPAAFPSHQGLILPLWRAYPRRVDGLALSIGAAAPDIVDLLAWPVRGELGQWAGHSLLGVALLCTPLGLLLTWLARRAAPKRWLARLEVQKPERRTGSRAPLSVAIGALSHVVFDLVTHANFLLLWPFYTTDRLFPSWWMHTWGRVAVPVYREPYPVAPHTVAWAVLTVAGAVSFFLCVRRR